MTMQTLSQYSSDDDMQYETLQQCFKGYKLYTPLSLRRLEFKEILHPFPVVLFIHLDCSRVRC